MLEKPDLSEDLLALRVREEYNMLVVGLTFLPLGADENTAVYRLLTETGTTYFLKLRKNFDEIIVRVPILLKEQGVQAIIVPVETTTKQHYADFGEYKIILYPFIEGKDGFEMELSDEQRQRLGAALKAVHSASLPSQLRNRIPQEIFSPQWREILQAFQAQVANKTFDEPTAAKLADCMTSRQEEIRQLVQRTEELASKLRSRPLELVLCHSDIHGGNVLIGNQGDLYIVDWDNPILAPKERDLMFIGGGIDGIWKSKREESVFYQGYGETDIDGTALAYYRYERILEDLAVICQQVLSTDEGGADRERSYGWFTSNFEPGGTIEIARKTDNP